MATMDSTNCSTFHDNRRSSRFYLPVKTVLKWLLLVHTVAGTHYGPSYTSTGRHCMTSSHCVTSIGEVCWWAYSGCEHGRCMCNPRTSFLDEAGHCRKRKYGGQSCSSRDYCPQRMACLSGLCQCVTRGMTMTSDKHFCLGHNERVLGQPCDRSTHCYQATGAGYKAKRTACVDGRCECFPGFKQEGSRCRRLNIAEGSCSKDHHCQGGALCVSRSCVCPAGYMAVAGNSKCAKQGAQFDLGIGSICDEVKERRYCSQGLVCQKCPNEQHSTCVKYREFESFNAGSTSRVDRTLTIICVLAAVLAALVFIIVRNYCCR